MPMIGLTVVAAVVSGQKNKIAMTGSTTMNMMKIKTNVKDQMTDATATMLSLKTAAINCHPAAAKKMIRKTAMILKMSWIRLIENALNVNAQQRMSQKENKGSKQFV
jgi:hypothetical protein